MSVKASAAASADTKEQEGETKLMAKEDDEGFRILFLGCGDSSHVQSRKFMQLLTRRPVANSPAVRESGCKGAARCK